MDILIACEARSQLLVIDVQEKLSAVMPQDAMQEVIKNCSILAQVAKLFEVPVMVTEQYPERLGHTEQVIMQHLEGVKPIAKIAFSACAEPKFNARLQRDKSQILIAGLEAHICVLQTALDLLAQGKQVFVIEDAIISRNVSHKTNAINRLAQAGCVMTNTESVVFEWLGNANHDHFKAVSKLIK